MIQFLRQWFARYGLMAIFVWIFLGIGLAVLGLGLWNSVKAFNSNSWPTAQGVITRADISTSTSDEDIMYAAEIRYTYQIDGQEMHGSQVTFGDISTSNQRNAERAVGQYKLGSAVQVYYNPDNPLEAVLQPGFTGGLLLPLGIGAAFTLVGGGMAAGMLRVLFNGGILDGE